MGSETRYSVSGTDIRGIALILFDVVIFKLNIDFRYGLLLRFLWFLSFIVLHALEVRRYSCFFSFSDFDRLGSLIRSIGFFFFHPRKLKVNKCHGVNRCQQILYTCCITIVNKPD
jgi:hypothetical protein